MCGLAPQPQPGSGEFGDRPGQRGQRQLDDTALRVVADLEHFRGGLAFREGESFFDDQRAAQGDGEQHAEQTAEPGDDRHPPVVEHVPVAQQHQRRDGKDHTGGHRLAGRGRGLHDVVLEDVGFPEQAEDAHRDHRRRDRGGHGHPGKQAEIGIRAGQDHRQDDAQDDRLDGQLRQRRGITHRCDSSEKTNSPAVAGLSCSYQPQVLPAFFCSSQPISGAK